MNFDEVQPDECMHMVSVDVAADIRSYIDELYRQMHQRNIATDGCMANVVLAGLTLVWIEAVHTLWNTPEGESAIGLLRGLTPEDKAVKREMRRAARDFLRRSGWWIRRTK